MTTRAIIWLAVSTIGDKNHEVSIPSQREEALAYCQDKQWSVVDTLEVPAHKFSIEYMDYAKEMLGEGISAYQSLLNHWKVQDFDVLVVNDKHRFAQSRTLTAYIIERTLDSGATIYSLTDGIINQTNYHIWLSMTYFSPAVSVEGMVERRKLGVDARVRKGLPPNGQVPISHRVVRDENNGKVLYVTRNEETSKMWDDLAQLILAGLSWRQISTRMYEEFGHTNPEGKPYSYRFFYKLVYTPSFWGSIALNFKHQSFGAWVYDEAEIVPEGVVINRGVHPAVWTGELAERIKAELRRREEENLPRKRDTGIDMFDNIFVCADCGGQMTHAIEDTWTIWRCTQHANSITDHKAKQYIDGLLRQMVEQNNPDMLLQIQPMQRDELVQSLNQTQHDMVRLQKQLERLLLQQAITEEANLRTTYDTVIQSTYQELKELQERHAHLWQRSGELTETQRQAAYRQFTERSVDEFWNTSPATINRTLLGLMDSRRFVVKNKEIIGAAEV